MKNNTQSVNLKSIFGTCQKNSENFKYREIFTQEDLVHNPFWYNAKIIPEINTFKTTYYKPLAKKKGIPLDEFHKIYWNDLREEFNDSPSSIETFKKYLLKILENDLFLQYFRQTDLLFQHFFNRDYSFKLFKNNSTDIFKLMTAFYIGDYQMIEERLESGFPGSKFFKIKNSSHEEFCKKTKELLLNIWDHHVKLTNVIEFPKRAIALDSSSKKPIKQVPNYKTITNGATDNRGAHNEGRKIVPEPELWEEAQKYFQKFEKSCLSSRDKKFPNGKMKKWLAGLTSNLELYGYEKRDKDKKNPIRLKRGMIRKLLGKNNEKWKVKK